MGERIDLYDITTEVDDYTYPENMSVRSIIQEFRSRPTFIVDILNSIESINAPYLVMTTDNINFYLVYDRADNLLIATASQTLCGANAQRDMQGKSQELITRAASASLKDEYLAFLKAVTLPFPGVSLEEWYYNPEKHPPEEFLLFGGLGFYSNEGARFTIDIDKLTEISESEKPINEIYPADIGLKLISYQQIPL